MKHIALILPSVLLHATLSLANDGTFRVNGNQLIPMYETDISVQKEILTIRRISPTTAQITVYYEFFNPKQEKTVEVGFEAFSPAGDVDHSPDEGGQRFISHFTVNLNGVIVPWKVVIVKDSSYYRNGKFKTLTAAQAAKEGDEESADFFYVYHFRSLFHAGVNMLKHTYVVDLSSSVIETYSLDYVLTAAKRWANRQIDDFTLQIEMGDYQDLSIQANFFQHASEWTMTGLGRSLDRPGSADTRESPVSEFFVHKGILVFKKMNFRPAGELSLSAPSSYYYYSKSLDKHEGDGPFKFDYRLDELPFSVDADFNPGNAEGELSKKIVRNLPFARRGYIFKSPEIQAYYAKQPWYMPDPAYVPVQGALTKKEQEDLGKN
jgi:hypothetical protein